MGVNSDIDNIDNKLMMPFQGDPTCPPEHRGYSPDTREMAPLQGKLNKAGFAKNNIIESDR